MQTILKINKELLACCMLINLNETDKGSKLTLKELNNVSKSLSLRKKCRK